ncbi:MAG: hypothetical protein H9W82_02045 [Lactobacillus sp.]|nr:hypothetical protein [Lactobacillus sp.]
MPPLPDKPRIRNNEKGGELGTSDKERHWLSGSTASHEITSNCQELAEIWQAEDVYGWSAIGLTARQGTMAEGSGGI